MYGRIARDTAESNIVDDKLTVDVQIETNRRRNECVDEADIGRTQCIARASNEGYEEEDGGLAEHHNRSDNNSEGNGQLVIHNIAFRGVSRYSAIHPGVFQIVIQQTNTTTVIGGSRTFTAVPNAAYTIAVTGPFTGPGGELLYNSTPFIFIENIFPPNQNTYKGTFHRLEESTATEDLEIVTFTYISGISQVVEKTVAYYAEQIPGPVTFNVLSLSGNQVNNSAGFPLTLNDTVGNNAIYDLFVTGNDVNNINPTELTSAVYLPTLEPVSGCILVDGSSIFPDSTPFTPFYSFQPCPPLNSASSMAAGIAILLVLVALLF